MIKFIYNQFTFIQSGYGGGQNWAPNHGMMRRPEPYKVKLGFITKI